jgi:hypothetical protein
VRLGGSHLCVRSASYLALTLYYVELVGTGAGSDVRLDRRAALPLFFSMYVQGLGAVVQGPSAFIILHPSRARCDAFLARRSALLPGRRALPAQSAAQRAGKRDFGYMESIANELLAHVTVDVADRQLEVYVGNKRGPRKRKGVRRSNQAPPSQVARLKLIGSESKTLLSSAPIPYAAPAAFAVLFPRSLSLLLWRSCSSATLCASTSTSTTFEQSMTNNTADSEGPGRGLHKLLGLRGQLNRIREDLNLAVELRVQQLLAISPWTVVRGAHGLLEFVNAETKERLFKSPFLRYINVVNIGAFTPHELQSKFRAVLHMEQPAAISITDSCANLDDGEAQGFLHREMTRRMVEQRRILSDDSTSAQWCALCAIMLSFVELWSFEVAAECCALLPSHVL